MIFPKFGLLVGTPFFFNVFNILYFLREGFWDPQIALSGEDEADM